MVVNWTPEQHSKRAQPKADKYSTSHFLPFNCCSSAVAHVVQTYSEQRCNFYNIFLIVHTTFFGRSPVVGDKESDQIVRKPQSVQSGSDVPNPFIHRGHHGAMHRSVSAGSDVSAIFVDVVLGNLLRTVNGLVGQVNEDWLGLVVIF